MEYNDTLQLRIIERCKKGDKKAEFALFSQYAKQMYNVAFRITGNSFEAEDVVQESFIKAFSKLKSFKGEATFGAWLKRIVVNQSISLLRKQKTLFEPINESVAENMHQEIEVTVEPDENMKQVMLAIKELPDGARIIFTLKAIEEYKFNEIAEMTEVSVSNCKVQYHRAKSLLREKLIHKVSMI